MSKVPARETSRETRQDTRQALIDAGTDIIMEKGFNNTGIEQVLKQVGVPKGSFYYYFKSKDDFGLSIIDHHAELFQKKQQDFLHNPTQPAIERLRNFFKTGRDKMEQGSCRKGCLFGNLGQEMADQHEAFRVRLEEIFQSWCESLSQCIREAQADGDIPQHIDADRLAEFCLFSWEGAFLRSKVTKSIQPLDTFLHLCFEELFKTRL